MLNTMETSAMGKGMVVWQPYFKNTSAFWLNTDEQKRNAQGQWNVCLVMV